MKKFYPFASLRAINFKNSGNLITRSFCSLFLLVFFSVHSFGQTTYNFSTPAVLSNQGEFYNTLATVIIDGVSYKITHLGNGNFTNLTNGGNANSACLKKDGAGGDFLKIERTDGAAFQFYGMWLNSSSMYSPPFYQPPYYNIKYYDQNNQEIVAETLVSSVQNETITVTKNLKVKYVMVTYNAVLFFKLDDLIVGPAAASPATVTTASVNQFTAIAALLGGNVTNEQGATVTERGIVYGTTASPTITDNKVTIGAGTGAFSQFVTGLNSSTLYYVRSYAVNTAGVSYGSQVSFTTAPEFLLSQIHYFNTPWVSTTNQPTPFVKYVEGWNITATSSGAGLVSVNRITGLTGLTAAGEGTASARAISSTTLEELVSMSFAASNNNVFSLQSFRFKYITKVLNTSFGVVKVTGYRNGVPVAADSITGILQATAAVYTYTTFDLSANYNFNAVDQFVITVSNPVNGARLSAIDVDVLSVSNPSTLPLKLISFTGQVSANQATLNWSTSQEQNSKDFDVEYSTDGLQYSKVGNVKAVGNNNSNNYTFTHNNIFGGNIYYRLKMNSIDGTSVYSKQLLLKNNSKNSELAVYPNPAIDNHFFVKIPQGTKLPLLYRIVNTAGKTVQTGTVTTNDQKIEVGALSKGNYFIIWNDGPAQSIVL